VPDERIHRGPHPADAELFAPEQIPRLREALADFSMLLTKGYADKSALKLVGDRFSLTQRQRLAIMRSACSDQQRQSRLERQVPIETLAGQPIAIDGYNLLITIEAAMSGGLIFRGRDGCFRDLASIHGTYRRVEETVPAVKLISEFLAEIRVAHTLWLFASEHTWPWEIRLTISPDAELSRTDTTVVSSDSVVLDACHRWTNLAAEIITQRLPQTAIIDLV
jgi:hypothetical protein